VREAKASRKIEPILEEEETPIAWREAPVQMEEEPPAEPEVEWIDDEVETADSAVADDREAAVKAPPEPSKPPPEIQWEEDATRSRRSGAKKRPNPVPEPELMGTVSKRVVPQGMIEVAEPLRRRGRKISIGFVVLGVIGIVAGTIGFNWWKNYRESLPLEAERDRQAGMTALQEAQFDEAKRRLSRASNHFELAGIRDERWIDTKDLAAQAAIAADLLGMRLEQLMDEAARLEEAEWAKRFRTLYQGRSVIIQDEVESPPLRGGQGCLLRTRYLTGVPPIPARVGRLDLENFKLFDSRDFAKGEKVLFSGRIRSVDLVGGEWLIRLEPESGVWITRQEILSGLGVDLE
jgi:hypothetical protein